MTQIGIDNSKMDVLVTKLFHLFSKLWTKQITNQYFSPHYLLSRIHWLIMIRIRLQPVSLDCSTFILIFVSLVTGLQFVQSYSNFTTPKLPPWPRTARGCATHETGEFATKMWSVVPRPSSRNKSYSWWWRRRWSDQLESKTKVSPVYPFASPCDPTPCWGQTNTSLSTPRAWVILFGVLCSAFIKSHT